MPTTLAPDPHLEDSRTTRAGWWRELRAIAALGGPVALVQVGMMLMGTVDTMMLGRVSKEALAAGALGHTVSFAIFGPVMGLFFAIEALVTQAVGAGDRPRVARHFARMVVLALYLSVPVVGLLLWVGPRLGGLRQSAELVPLADGYLRGVAPGVAGFFLFLVLRLVLQAEGLVRPALVAVVGSNLVNVAANYGLVFGGFGLPALGVYGSGLATSIARWSLCLILLLAGWGGLRRMFRGELRPAQFVAALRPREHAATFRLGLPIALHNAAEFWVFSAVGLMMGSLGALQFAAHQIALNLAALTFMVPLGIASAAATRVGNAVGRLDAPGVRRAARVSLIVGAGVMSVSALVFALAPRLLSRAYTPDPEVVALAALLLPIAAVFQVADGFQVVAAGVLRGAADTTWPAAIALIGFWVVGLPLGALFAYRWALGPLGLWWGLTAGLAATAVALGLRVRARLAHPVQNLQAERDLVAG
ncbi:MAG TPA: MATE family efflux transporter [Thermoanaerobaculia bacterium]|nr:MATE family efflux transporter [Thermoanaerobaculia bacterium]